MNFFKFGLRSVLGIMLPGAIIVLIACYAFLSVCILVTPGSTAPTPAGIQVTNQTLAMQTANSPDSNLHQHAPQEKLLYWVNEQKVLTLIVLFLASYFLGSMVRLNAADEVDEESGLLSQKRFKSRCSEAELKELEDAYTKLRTGEKNVALPDSFDEWIWRREKFPYPVWQFRKFKLYHPPEITRFFESYRKCMNIGFGRRGKEFFNYCKMVICHSTTPREDSVLQEVHLSEGTVRFYAGAYYALRYALWLLVPLCLIHGVMFWVEPSRAPWIDFRWVHILVTVTLTVVAFQIKRTLLLRFRTLRLKEVDTVYDAFYLAHRHIETCPTCSNPEHDPRPTQYSKRNDLLREAFSESTRGVKSIRSVDLDVLVSLMKDRSRTSGFLSSIYFAGAEEDHPFFLKNDHVAIGLSVLPEDEPKTSVSKRHPHQEEVIVVLDGNLRLERDENGNHTAKNLERGDVVVLHKNQCHRILPVEKNNAVYLFIKTNPAQAPRGIECSLNDAQ
jgi:mannose-6-phosphate isomerase-like protein (cupin superfamily)